MVDMTVPDNILDLIEKDGSVPKFMAKQMAVELQHLRSLYRANITPTSGKIRLKIVGYGKDSPESESNRAMAAEWRKSLDASGATDVKVVYVTDDEIVGPNETVTVIQEWPR